MVILIGVQNSIQQQKKNMIRIDNSKFHSRAFSSFDHMQIYSSVNAQKQQNHFTLSCFLFVKK